MDDWPTIKLLRRFSSSRSIFRLQRNDRLTTVRPIVGKFEGIVFTESSTSMRSALDLTLDS